MKQYDLQALIAKRTKLEAQIAEARKQGRRQAIATAKLMMREYGLVIADLSAPEGRQGRGSASASASETQTKARKPVAPKYRDDAGNTWSGRGLQPRWLTNALAKGKSLSSFAI